MMLLAAALVLTPTGWALAHGGGAPHIPARVGAVVALQVPPPPKPGMAITPRYPAKRLAFVGLTKAKQQWTFRFRPRVSGSSIVTFRLLDKPGGKQVGRMQMTIDAKR